MKSSLKSLLLIGVALLVLSGCATAPSSSLAPDQLLVVKDAQGAWEGNLYEVGWGWHVFSGEDGNTGSYGAMTFNGLNVHFVWSDLVNPSWSAAGKPRVKGGEATLAYTVVDNGIIYIKGRSRKFFFKITGQDNLEGYRDDYPGLVWKFHRVTKKEVATVDEKKTREEPKQEPPTSVSLPTSSGGMGASFR